jgi:small multidrug resistance pump
VGWVFFEQRLDTPAPVGLSLIAAGVLVLYLFSKTAVH